MNKQQILAEIQSSPKVAALVGDPVIEGSSGIVTRYMQKVLYQVGDEVEIRGILFYVVNPDEENESAYFTTSNKSQIYDVNLRDLAKNVFKQMKSIGEITAARVLEEDTDGEYLVARVLLPDPRNASNGPTDIDRPDFIVDYRITKDANHPTGCSWRPVTEDDRTKIIQYETLKAGGSI